MAYDPKDPKDVAIVEGLVEAALAEATTQFEADTAGLKAKNQQLLAKIAKGADGSADAGEVSRLEAEVETLTAKVKDSDKAIKTLTKERDTAAQGLESESAVTRKLLVDNGLTEALVAAKVAPQFLPAVKAMLAGQVTVKTDGENRLAVVGDKSLGDFVKDWSQGDDGKHYIAAPANGGSGAPGGKADGGGTKTMTRDAYNEMAKSNPNGVGKFFSEGGTLTE